MTSQPAVQIIRTPRLTLRGLRPEDAPAIAEGVGNYDVSKWLSVVPYPYGLEDAQSFISKALGNGEDTWALESGDGVIGLMGARPEFGYWLARPAWGRGLATEAGDALIDHAFSAPDLPALRSACFVGNDRSRRVLEKLGFQACGRKRIEAAALRQTVDAVKMSLSRAHWQSRRRFRVSTDRLDIREIHAEDWRDMQRLAGIDAVARMLLSVRVPWPAEDVRRWIGTALYRGRPGFRTVIGLKDGTVIGGIGLGRAGGRGPMTCMYWLGRDFWGRGFATEAMRAFLAECYARFPELDAIEADHFTDNPASARVLEKLGFARVGTGTGQSAARLEPAPVILYRVSRDSFGATR